jgi:[CysO sulfur-carrier protein]-S-L-cysteine hydrolase
MPLPAAIPRIIWERLLDEARKNPATECCGLLGGRDGSITSIYPAPNDHHSATAYQIAPADLFRSMREIRAAGEEFVGIYHSHPAGENRPSARDLELAYYPEVAYVIVSPTGAGPHPVRAFSIRKGIAVELKLNII